MKKIIFEVRYYLLFLILTLSLFLALIFNPVSSSNGDDTDFSNKEVTRGSIQINEIALLNENEEQTSNRTQIIYVEKNNTLIELLDEAGLSNKYIRALIKAKGSEKLANLKTGDKLGKVFTDKVSGKTKLLFILYKNTTKLNPSHWIRTN